MTKQLSEAATEQLKACTVEGKTLYLPKGQFLKRDVFLEIRNKLQATGAKYKTGSSFQFETDPKEILKAIFEGNDQELIVDVDLLSTPVLIADMIVQLAEIKPMDSVCEPSAGTGSIINAVYLSFPNKSTHWYEKKEALARVTDELPMVVFHGLNFLEEDPDTFDKFVACPPLTKNQDIKHVLRMYDKLRPKGRIVSVMSTAWQTSEYSACINFRAWIKKIKATIVFNPPSSYMAGKTPFPTCIVIIDKP